MKNTGMVRKIDELGRIVLPMEIRRTLDVGEREPLEIMVDGNNIILRKYNQEKRCAICETEEELEEFTGKYICSCCAAEISHRVKG